MWSLIGGKGTVDILVKLGLGGMKEEVNATTDGNTKLAFCEKESGKTIGVESHDDCTSNATIGGTNAYRS